MLFDSKDPIKSFAEKMGMRNEKTINWGHVRHDLGEISCILSENRSIYLSSDRYLLITSIENDISNDKSANTIEICLSQYDDNYYCVNTIIPYKRSYDSYFVFANEDGILDKYDLQDIINMNIPESIKTFIVYNLDKVKSA